MTVAQVRARFPEFGATDFPDSDVQSEIAAGQELHSEDTEAALFVVAHLLALREERTAEPDGGSGEVVSDGVGPRQASYMSQASNGHEVFFSTTSYGRTFLALERRTARRAVGFIVA